MSDGELKKAKMTGAEKAPIVASIVALALIVIKLTVGLYSGAMVLIASAVDSGLDFLVSVFNFFAIRYSEKPSDEIYNYGRGKLKAIASVLEGGVIVVSAIFIALTAIHKIINQNEIQHTSAAMAVMVVSTLITGLLVMYLSRVARETGDLVVKADALHYKVDLWSNLGILLALFIIAKTNLFILDPIFSIGIAIYIVVEAVKLIREGVFMLMDRALDTELVEQIVAILEDKDNKVTSHHLLKTRQAAQTFFVDVHLVYHRHISLLEAHASSEKIEKRIRKLNKHQWVINCHLDPIDDLKRDITVHKKAGV